MEGKGEVLQMNEQGSNGRKATAGRYTRVRIH